MTSPKERINEKLKATESIISDVETELNSYELPDYLKQLQLESFEKRLSEINSEKEEVDYLIGKEEMTLTMRPQDLPSGEVGLRDFTLIAGGFQELADSVANTIFNQPSEKGKIPNEVLDKNEMILKETKAGSFIAVLNIRHPEQTSLDEPDSTQTIKELFSLFDSSDDENLLAEKVSLLGPRALKNYVNWTKIISEVNTPVDIVWRSAYSEKSSMSFNRENAGKIYNTLNNFSDAKEEDISLEGKLTGTNIRTETFELISNEEERISGRISKDSLQNLTTPNYNKTYFFELIKVIITGPGFKEKVSWTLKDISEK